MFTDEQLQQELQDINEGLKELPDPDKSLSKEERKRKYLLLMKKDVLEKIKQAKEKNDKSQEFDSSIDYAVLTSFGEKHPILMHLAKMKFKWSIYH